MSQVQRLADALLRRVFGNDALLDGNALFYLVSGE